MSEKRLYRGGSSSPTLKRRWRVSVTHRNSNPQNVYWEHEWEAKLWYDQMTDLHRGSTVIMEEVEGEDTYSNCIQ